MTPSSRCESRTPPSNWRCGNCWSKPSRASPSPYDVAKEFYDGDLDPPIQEVILPFTTNAAQIVKVRDYYAQFIAGQESRHLPDGSTVSDWIGDFYPKHIRVIPLFEERDQMMAVDDIVREYLQGWEVEYQRVFLARSDPALNNGIVGAELMLKTALARLDRLEG